jgi:predicted nuclease of predicted toxin-antitoxin system
MKILFDQGTPVPLRACLTGRHIETAAVRGWSELSNGDLPPQAESEGFEAMVTADQNLHYQQNLSSRTIAILVLINGCACPLFLIAN